MAEAVAGAVFGAADSGAVRLGIVARALALAVHALSMTRAALFARLRAIRAAKLSEALATVSGARTTARAAVGALASRNRAIMTRPLGQTGAHAIAASSMLGRRAVVVANTLRAVGMAPARLAFAHVPIAGSVHAVRAPFLRAVLATEPRVTAADGDIFVAITSSHDLALSVSRALLGASLNRAVSPR